LATEMQTPKLNLSTSLADLVVSVYCAKYPRLRVTKHDFGYRGCVAGALYRVSYPELGTVEVKPVGAAWQVEYTRLALWHSRYGQLESEELHEDLIVALDVARRLLLAVHA
jgi:hypothetical protein